MKLHPLLLSALGIAAIASTPGCGSSPDDSTSSAASASSGAGAGGASSASSGGVTCPSPVAADPLASMRAQCAFTAGAKVEATLGIDAAAQAAMPIKNIIVVMKENRSFDHILGKLHEKGQPDTEAIPANFTNPDNQNVAVAPYHEPLTCLGHDPDHQWTAMHVQVDGGKMDGFVTSAATSTGTDGHFVMGVYDDTDLPFYYFLANTYALNDRHFASVRSGTFPNRNFLLLGTADGVKTTGGGYPDPATPTIFDELDQKGISWGAYADIDPPFEGTLNWPGSHAGVHTVQEFLAGLEAGKLPQVAFVDSIENVEDEHPTANVQAGEAWTKKLYDHAVSSPLWPGIAMIWTYDEAGGFADHVPPPNQACIARPIAKDMPFFELGARVPFVVISPWARAHHVSHVVQDHTAVTRFVEAVFDLPALTARDANSDALLDMFDFACAPALLSPPPAPAAGDKGCFPQVMLSTDKPSYSPGDPIKVSFSGAPGNNPIDWIAVYPYGPSGPTPPHPGSFAWQYIGGSHVGGASPAMGTITIDASAIGGGQWPMPVGSYTAYYLLDDGYTSVASIDFTVQ